MSCADPSRRRLPRRSRASHRVLVTGGEYVGVLAAVRGLRDAGYEPWVTVTGPGAYAARSRAVAGACPVPDPGERPDDFVDAVDELAARADFGAILPGMETSLHVLAQRTGRFRSDVPLAVCDAETVARATDKASLAGLAQAAGLEAPPSLVLTESEARRRARTLTFPAVVKPMRSEMPGPEGALRHCVVHRVEGVDEVIRVLRELPGNRGVIQPYLSGRLTAVGGVFWDGEIVAAVRQAAERTWPADCGQMAYAVTVPRDRGLERRLERLLRLVGWRGLFQVQFIENDDGRYLIDLNPRIYASLGLALAAGQNLPAVWVDLLLGREVRPQPYRVGIRFRSELLDPQALAAAAARGRLRTALAGAVPRPRTAHAVFARDDPMPLLSILRRRSGLRSTRGGSGAAG